MNSQMNDMEAARLLEKVSPLPIPPFILNEHIYDTLAENPAQDEHAPRPLPSWTFAKKAMSGTTKMPQTIAHRGYKAKFPENTMSAFRGAADVGTHAIETDVHLTKDDVVVLSHDGDLKRCFGKDEKIIDCCWEDIRDLQTLATPRQTMPSLQDLLEFLASPDTSEDIWLLLDIKLDNNASDIIRLIASTINSVKPHTKRPWHRRIVLGIWAAKYLPLCVEHLPSFPATHIGFSTSYARQFFHTPNVSFNMLQHTLRVPYFGARFIHDAHGNGRPVYTWTINDADKMRWTIQAGLDGVCTDDPKRFLDVCDEWEQGYREFHISRKDWMMTTWTQLMIFVFGAIFWWKHGGLDLSQERTVPHHHHRRQPMQESRRGEKRLPPIPMS